MSVRYYANAPATTLSSSVTALATNIDVASITGFPISYPFILILDRGTASEEVVLVTAGTGTSLTVTRGYDGTTAFSHSSSGSVEHGISAIEMREANEHVNATSAVHGVTGNVVGDEDAQTLTNKDLSDPTNVFPASLATDADITAAEAYADGVAAAAQTAAEATADAALTAHEADTAAHGVTGDVVGTTDTQTLTNKTLDSPTITGVGSVQRAIKTADETCPQLSETLQNDNHLFFTLEPGTWIFDLALIAEGSTSSSNADMKAGFSFSGTQTQFLAGQHCLTLGTSSAISANMRADAITSIGSTLSSGIVNDTKTAVFIRGSITVTVAGTFRFQFAQELAFTQDVTVKKGSWMRAERVI